MYFCKISKTIAIYFFFSQLILINIQTTISHTNVVNGSKLNIISEVYRLVYIYPKFYSAGVSKNFSDFCATKDSLDIVLTNIIQQDCVNFITNLLINSFLNQLHAIPDEERENYMKQQREKKFIANCFALSLENWILEKMDVKEFIIWIKEVIKQFAKEDEIIIYLSAINDNQEKIQEAYKKSYNQEFIQVIAEYCLFFPIFKSQKINEDFHKVTFPSRINYPLLKDKLEKNGIGLLLPYQYGGRWVLTKIVHQVYIKKLNPANLLNTFTTLLSSSKISVKPLASIRKNIINGNLVRHFPFLRLLSMYYLHTLSKNKKSNLDKSGKNLLNQYAYWQICKMYSSIVLREYKMEIMKKRRQK